MHKLTATITPERLKELLDYNPETGIFTWRQSRGKAYAGCRAGKSRTSGRYITIDGVTHTAARLAWLYVNGAHPERLLRFKDGNGDNAAISNLTYGDFDHTTQAGKAAYQKHWVRNNPRSQRHLVLKRAYGLTIEQYQQMLLDQKGVCGCCGKPETTFQSGKLLPLAVDHCHTTHEIRGLLCANCNRGIGLFKDEPATLESAAAYLRAHAAKPKSNVIPLSGRKIAAAKGNAK